MNPTTKTTKNGYWTEGKIVDGTNVGGGQFVLGTEPISKVITQDDLNTTTKLNPVPPVTTTIPPTPTVTAPQGMAIGADGTATYTPPPLPPEPSAKEKTLRQKTMELIGIDEKLLEQQPEVTKQLQERLQVVEKENNKVQTYNAWMLKKREIEKKIQELQAQTGGKTTAGVRDEVELYSRKASAELADLAIQAQVAQGLVDSARQTIKDTIEAQFSPIEDRIARRTQYAQLAANDLTESEKYQLDQLNRKDEANQKEVSTYATNLANTVFENGAPVGVRTKIFNIAGDYATRKITKEQAQAKMMEAAGNYGVKPGSAIAGLPPFVQTKVQTIANQFDSEQAVKNYQTAAEAIDALNTAGTSPTDDIGRVYAFAKVMDPNSVVREGEYKTVQDYSTAVLERAGLKAKRIFDNTGFLTQEARNFMKTTLDNRLASSKKAYDNIYSEYGRRINKVTNLTDGTDYLTDYSRAFVNKDTTQLQQVTEGITKEWNGVTYKVVKGVWTPQ